MKKVFTYLFSVLSVAAVMVSCVKETGSQKPAQQEILTIVAGNPAVKTSMEGTTPSWSADDQLDIIYTNSDSQVVKAQSNKLDAATSSAASFTVALTNPDAGKTAYACYPVNGKAATATTAILTIADSQSPSATSFDGASDILVSEGFTPAGTVSAGFKRLGAILKVSVANSAINDEKLENLTVSVTDGDDQVIPLTGDVSVTLDGGDLAGISNGGDATAVYASASQFTVSGNYAYLVVYPQVIPAGSKITVSGQTSGHNFTKTSPALASALTLTGGHILPIGVSVADEGISEKAVLADKVFFEESFAKSDGASGWSGSAGNGTFTPDNTGWTVVKAYGAGGAAKFGTGSAKGSGKTPAISIDDEYKAVTLKLSFDAGAWDSTSENTTLMLSGTNCKLKNTGADLTSVTLAKGAWTTYTVDITEISGDINITFEASVASNNRFFLDNVKVFYESKQSPDLVFAAASATAYLGDNFAEPVLTNPHGVSVSYASDNTAVATVDAASGVVSLVGEGVANISASFEGNATYKAQEVSYQLTVITPVITVAPDAITMGGSADDESTIIISINAPHSWTATLDATAQAARGVKFDVLDGNGALIEGPITGSGASTQLIFKAKADGASTGDSSYGTISFTDDIYTAATSGAVSISQNQHGSAVSYTDVAHQVITFSSLYSADTGVDGVTIPGTNNWSMVFSKAEGGTAPKYYQSGTAVRAYAKNTITISAAVGFKISTISFGFGSGDASNAITADKGTYESGTWTGTIENGDSVVFTIGGTKGNRRIASVSVN